MSSKDVQFSRQTHFFVIEDDPDHRKIAEKTLQSAGIDDITMFQSGEEAMIYFSEIDPSAGRSIKVILIDLMLPNISGFEILKQLKKDERWRSSHIIILTCSTSPEDRVKSQMYGADDFLCKPFRLEYVEQIISSLSSNSA